MKAMHVTHHVYALNNTLQQYPSQIEVTTETHLKAFKNHIIHSKLNTLPQWHLKSVLIG